MCLLMTFWWHYDDIFYDSQNTLNYVKMVIIIRRPLDDLLETVTFWRPFGDLSTVLNLPKVIVFYLMTFWVPLDDFLINFSYIPKKGHQSHKNVHQYDDLLSTFYKWGPFEDLWMVINFLKVINYQIDDLLMTYWGPFDDHEMTIWWPFGFSVITCK